MGTTNILDLNNRIDALEKSFHELKIWTSAEAKSVSGNPITLTDGRARKAEGLSVTCNPKQNLHGYDHPWAGGAGKNKLIISDLTTLKSLNTGGTWSDNKYTYRGVTYTVITDNDGNVTGINANGTATGGLSDFYFTTTTRKTLDNYGLVVGNSYIFTSGLASDVSGAIMLFNGAANNIEASASGTAFTVNSTDIYTINIRIYNGTTVNNALFKPMVRLSTESDATFEPYSNICPITGYTECVVDVKDEDETTQDTATITFGQTVYGGSVDFKTGKVTVTHASIASYNGETINEPWLSSIDEYVSGTTPTIGAQVVYPLTTPIELTLTPADLELLKGYNYITSNGTTIDLTYLPDSLKAEILLTVSQLYGSKVSIFDEILAGGDTGQVLTKTSDDNYDATWATLPTTRTANKK